MAAPFVTTTDLSEASGGVSMATARGTAVLTAACDMVRLFTEQELSPAVVGGTAILDGTGTDKLLLPQYPVTLAGTVIESGGTLTAGTDYKLNNNGVLYRLPGIIDSGWGDQQLRTYWWPGRQNVVVTYDYGYSSVPADLKEVAIQMAKRLHSSRESDVVFEQLGQRSKRWSGPGSDWTNSEAQILRRYKRAQ